MSPDAVRGRAGCGRWPWVTLGLTAIALVVATVPGLAWSIEFARDGVAAGEIWRWIGGHFAHASLDHLLWDAGAFVVLGALCEREGRWPFVAVTVAAALLIPVALCIGQPDLASYRGLSGLDAALFMLLVAQVGRRGRAAQDAGTMAVAAILALGLVAKIAFEFGSGANLFVAAPAADVVSVPLAHAVGGALGLAGGLFPRRPVFAPGGGDVTGSRR